MSNQTNRSPFNHSAVTYNGDFQAHLLEQYKLYVQSAENVSARRIASSRYLLTLSAAIVALYGLQYTNFDLGLSTLIIPVVGIAVALVWRAVIRSHADLNRAKFEIIHKLEELLPAAVYRNEWELLGKGESGAYWQITKIERWIPWIFGLSHAVLSVVIFLENAGLVDLMRKTT